jgi:hypothetical protein
MAANARAVPDEARRWWEIFIGDQGEEEVDSDSDSDSDFERVSEGEQNAGDGQTAAAAHARVAREGSSARHGQGKKRDSHVCSILHSSLAPILATTTYGSQAPGNRHAGTIRSWGIWGFTLPVET